MAIRKTLGTWPVLIAAVACVLLGAVAHAVNPFLEYRREALEGLQLWRLLTAHAAHLGLTHGALNGAALVFVWLIGRDSASRREWAWALYQRQCQRAAWLADDAVPCLSVATGTAPSTPA